MLLLAVWAGTVTQGGPAAHPAADSRNAQTLRELKRTRPRALVEADTTPVASLLADEFQLVRLSPGLLK